jgi:hypothetical protein
MTPRPIAVAATVLGLRLLGGRVAGPGHPTRGEVFSIESILQIVVLIARPALQSGQIDPTTRAA